MVTPPVEGEEAEGGVATGKVPAASRKRKIEDMKTGQENHYHTLYKNYANNY